MKISNSKKQLAKIIHENGGWRDRAQFSAQDKDGEVFHYAEKPTIGAGREVWSLKGCIGEGEFTAEKLPNWHQTILSRDEYFHLYPAPDADGWIEWNGGECPVDEGAVIDVKFRNGTAQTACAARCDKSPNHRYWTWIWSHSGHESDIIAYRLHKPEQAKSTAVGDDETNLATKEEPEAMEYKPTIEQLAADYRNRKDYADRKQQEADAAKSDAEAKLAALVAAGTALGLVLSVADAPEPELVITDWRDLRVGDEVKAKCHGGVLTGFITEMEPNDYDGGRPFRFQPVGDSPRWCTSPVFRFISRPSKGEANA